MIKSHICVGNPFKWSLLLIKSILFHGQMLNTVVAKPECDKQICSHLLWNFKIFFTLLIITPWRSSRTYIICFLHGQVLTLKSLLTGHKSSLLSPSAPLTLGSQTMLSTGSVVLHYQGKQWAIDKTVPNLPSHLSELDRSKSIYALIQCNSRQTNVRTQDARN